MTKPNPKPRGSDDPTVPSGVVTDHEGKRRMASAVQAATQALVARHEEQTVQEMLDIIAELEKPVRSNVPSIYEDPAPHRGTLRTKSPTEPMYARMSESVREWRNPDSDHWMAEWIRGHFDKDRPRMLEAQANLDALFGRADLHEGTAGADGAISTGTGGALVPRPLENVVMIARDRVAKMRRFANVMTMTRQTHTIPTAAAMTAAMAGEGATAAQGEPTIAEVQITAKKGQAVAIASKELLEDAAVNLVSVLATRAGGALGVLEDNKAFRLGDGAGNNIVRISGTTFSETTSGSMAYADMLRMYFAVAQEYRDMGVWLIAANVLQLLSNVRDGQGRPFYQGITDVPGAVVDDSGQIGTILRRPVYQVPFSNGEIWFGDAQAAYTLGNRKGLEMEVSRDVNFLSDEIVWKWTQRFGGIPVDAVAAQYATGITACTSL
jgi:HK97 family phage major capsid protein